MKTNLFGAEFLTAIEAPVYGAGGSSDVMPGDGITGWENRPGGVVLAAHAGENTL